MSRQLRPRIGSRLGASESGRGFSFDCRAHLGVWVSVPRHPEQTWILLLKVLRRGLALPWCPRRGVP